MKLPGDTRAVPELALDKLQRTREPPIPAVTVRGRRSAKATVLNGVSRVLALTTTDEAVAYGVLASVWQVLAAPVTILMIAGWLNSAAQGFYYTFNSLVALQTYVELGLSIVVLSAASHEWAFLGLDARGRIIGDNTALSRLVSLGRFVFVWYSIAAFLFFVAVGGVGHWFLARQAVGDVTWVSAWWVLVLLTSLQLWALPFNALLEGCNQVVSIQKLRFGQAVLRSLAMWTVLAAHGQLWAAVAAAGVAFGRDMYLLLVRYRRFFAPFVRPPSGPRMSWQSDIWPMQWRLAASASVSYLLFQAFTPVMFNYHGPVVAGQMGMTLSIVFAVQGIASMWLQPKVPTLGMCIARRDYAGLDAMWWRITRVCFLVATSGAVAAWLLIWGLNRLHVGLAHRLLPPLPAGLFLACAGFLAVGYCETAYLRAHKREPLLVLSVVTSLLMGVLVWQLGSRFGPTGAAVAYLTVIAGVSLPWQTLIWLRSRREWHRPGRAT